MHGLQTLLVERPYAELIWKGQAKLVISHMKLPSGCKLGFADTKQQYGVVTLGKAKPIAISEFRRLQKHHRIPDAERIAMWPKARRLFSHVVKFEEYLSDPQPWAGPPPEIETRFRRELNKTERSDKRLIHHMTEVFTVVEMFKHRIGDFVEQQLRLAAPQSDISLLLNSMVTLARDVRKEYANALEYKDDHQIVSDERLPETLDLADNLWAVMKEAQPLLPSNSRIGELTKDGIEMLEDFIKVTNHLREDSDASSALGEPGATKPSEVDKCNTDENAAIYKENDEADIFKDEVQVYSPFLYIIDNKTEGGPEVIRMVKRITDDVWLNKAIATQPNQKFMMTTSADQGEHPSIPVYDLILRKREEYQAFIALQDSGVMEMVAAEKDDPYLDPPPKEKPLKSVLQFHTRGRAAHLDFRIKVDQHLIGYTLAGAIAGRIPQFLDLDEAKQLAGKFDMRGSRWNKAFTSPKRIYATLKAVHPVSWMNIAAEAFEPGSVGGSKYHAGYMVKIASPQVSWGVHTREFHEYFLEEDKEFQGILVFRKLESQAREHEQGEEGPAPKTFWVAMFKQNLVPYIVSQKSINSGIVPARNWSFLPPQLKSVVPDRFKYWTPTDPKERKETRQELIKERFFTPENVKFVNGQIRRVVPKYHLYNPNPLKEDQAKREETNIYQLQHHGPPADHEDTELKRVSQTKFDDNGEKVLSPFLQKGDRPARVVKAVVHEALHGFNKEDGVNHRYKFAVGPVSKDVWEGAITLQQGHVQAHFLPIGWVETRDILAEVGDVIHVHVNKFIYVQDKVKRIEAVGQHVSSVDKVDVKNPLSEITKTTIEELESMILPEEIKKSHADAVDAYARNLVGMTKQVRLLKYETRDATQEGEEEERFVLGEVLVPDEDDSQEDTYDVETVRRAAHYFMEYSPVIGLMHERALSRAKVRVLESYIAPVDMDIEGRFVKKGTWLLGARIVDDMLWESVKAGTFTGWSIEGTAIAEEIS